MKRVVITGLGTVSPIGLSTQAYWAALVAGKSGFGAPTIFDSERLNTRVVAEVKGFVPADHFDTRQIGFLDRTPRGRVATRLAYDHFGIKYGRQPELF